MRLRHDLTRLWRNAKEDVRHAFSLASRRRRLNFLMQERSVVLSSLAHDRCLLNWLNEEIYKEQCHVDELNARR